MLMVPVPPINNAFILNLLLFVSDVSRLPACRRAKHFISAAINFCEPPWRLAYLPPCEALYIGGNQLFVSDASRLPAKFSKSYTPFK
jgi:hypothetical protein